MVIRVSNSREAQHFLYSEPNPLYSVKLKIYSYIILCSALLASTLSLQAQVLPTKREQRQMLQEEQSFLKAMRPGLQHTQMLAVKAGINGDTQPLQHIRQSRNLPPSLPEGVDTTYVTPKLCLFRPKASTSKPMPIMLYLHGGGWCFGSINSCARFCANVALRANCCVVALDYRLSPEHPFPTPLTDCQDAFRFVKSHAAMWGADSCRVSIGGDRAGGNLAIACGMSLDGVRSIIPIYPVTLLFTQTSPSWNTYAQGYGDDAELLEAFNEAYARSEAHHPLVSVGTAPDSLLQRLPPTLFLSAGHDILFDQGRDFVTRLQKLGKQVDYHVFPTATHLFITVGGQPTAHNKAVELVAHYLNK